MNAKNVAYYVIIMGKYHNLKLPGESKAYRATRDKLLAEEMKLRRNVESVAALRRKLPFSGKLKEDYVFDEMKNNGKISKTKFSELFLSGKNTLIVYNFMYHPNAKKPCPMCTSLLDGLNGNAPYISDRVNFVVVAKAPIEKIQSWAAERGWNKLRLLSSFGNTYNADYLGETPAGDQMPSLNVFQKTQKGMFHFYNTELLFAPAESGQGSRHVDMLWPLWNMFDLTPEGRGKNWDPNYQK